MNKINIIRDLLVSLKNGYSNKNKYAYCKLNSLIFKKENTEFVVN